MKMKTSRNRLLLICFLLMMSLIGCSTETTPVEHPSDSYAIQKPLQTPQSHMGQMKQVVEESKVEQPVTTYLSINDIRVKVPDSYTTEQVTDGQLPHIVLYSTKNNDTIELYTGTLAAAVSSNEAADAMADWFIDTYYPNGQPKRVGNSTKTGTTIQNSIDFTDDMTLTYLCIKTDCIALLHNNASPVVPSIIEGILNGSQSSENEKDVKVQTLPKNYTALQGAHYYAMKTISKSPSVFIIFPLTNEKTTLQVFDKTNKLLYDTYLMKNSMYYANSVRLKLDSSYILYVSKNMAIAPVNEVSNNEQSNNSQSE